MTSIDKLLIRGVRSFSQHHPSIIEFYKPLTLIVGPNGAGKTTIIECLKYSATGELPPDCSNGQAFIHDTNVAGEKEVKAQVKLQFRNVNGKPILITRSMQLVQKASKQEYRTIDSALRCFNENNEVVSQGNCCADLDKEIPELMGVSKAILQNVIFCHQEEANWPLDDSASLKRRFDAIFASTRYTKALEDIAKQRKVMDCDLKEHKLKLKTVEANLGTTQKMRKEVEDTEKVVESLQEEINKLKGDISEKEKKEKELLKSSEEVKEAMRQLSQLATIRDQTKLESEEIRSTLKEELEGELEELLRVNLNFSEEVEVGLQKKMELEKSRFGMMNEKSELEKSGTRLAEEFGKFKSSMEHYTLLKTSRDSHIVNITNLYKVTLEGYSEGPFEDALVDKFFTYTNELSNKARGTLLSIQEENKKIYNEKVQEIESIRREYNDLLDKIAAHSRTIDNNKSEMSKITRSINEKKSLYAKLGEMEAELKTKKERISMLKNGFDPEEVKEQMKQLDIQKRKSDEKVKEASQAMKVLNRHASQRAELHHLSKTKEEAERLYAEKLSECEDQMKSILGHFPNPETAKSELEDILKSYRAKIQKDQKNLDEAKHSASLTKGQRESIEHQLQQFNEQLKLGQQKLASLNDKSLPDTLKELEESMDDLKQEVTKMQSEEIMYNNFVNIAKKKKCCPLCDRDLDGNLEPFVKKLLDTLQKVPDSLKDYSEDLSKKEKIKKRLIQLKPEYDTVHRLQNKEIPEITSRMTIILEKESSTSNTISQLTPNLDKLKSMESQVSKLVYVAEEISRIFREISQLGQSIAEEQKKLHKKSDDTRTIEEVVKEMEKFQAESEQCAKQRDILFNKQKKTTDELYKEESACATLEKQILEIRNVDDDIYVLKQKSDKFQAEMGKLEVEVEILKENSILKKGEMKKVTEEREAFNKEATKQEQEYALEKDKFVNSLMKLENFQHQIKNYLNEDFSLKIQQVDQKKKQTEQNLEKINKRLQKLDSEIQTLMGSLSSKETLKRNLEDNIRWRGKLDEIRNIEKQIFKLQKQVDAKKKVNPTVMEDINRLGRELAKQRTERDKCEGACLTHKETIHKRMRELKSKQYATIDEEHRLQLISLQTTDMAWRDLEKYYKALDKALMQYHTLKMNEINQIMKELWQSTYKGNDIESLEIRADLDLKETDSRRVKKYRVVMLKGGIPLNMRGRCSAGQKVLASLIIRLALAETFCLNCGILALDEPTTNLDRHNVESFALALVKIISNRKQQKNFQLIIITHDEDFVQLLGRSEHADYYWRVTKDTNGHSTIERHQIVDL